MLATSSQWRRTCAQRPSAGSSPHASKATTTWYAVMTLQSCARGRTCVWSRRRWRSSTRWTTRAGGCSSVTCWAGISRGILLILLKKFDFVLGGIWIINQNSFADRFRCRRQSSCSSLPARRAPTSTCCSPLSTWCSPIKTTSLKPTLSNHTSTIRSARLILGSILFT